MDLNNVIRCKRCRRIFSYLGYGPKFCPDCVKKDEEDFQKVKEYLRDNPGMTLTRTSEDCDVKIEVIREWLREERLEYSSAEDIGLTCESCGKPITSGRFCNECKTTRAKAANELSYSFAPQKTSVKKQEKTGDKMRFLNDRR